MTADVKRRLLVVANDAVESDTIGPHMEGDTEVLVIAPALNTRLNFWAGDDRRARSRAEERLASSLHSLDVAGIEAVGFVADADPLLAIEDALQLFDANRIVISTPPDGRSNWLARGLVERARDRFTAPVEPAPGAL